MNSDLNLRKRGMSDSPKAGNSKLGETVSRSPKRSFRFSKSQISETNKSDPLRSNDEDNLDGINQDSDKMDTVPPQ